jgi:aminoglycoside phosphotransferase (APT) family kinase protein
MSGATAQTGLDRSGPEWSTLTEFLRETLHPEARSLAITHAERPIGGASWETIFVSFDSRDEDDQVHSDRVVLRRAPVSGPLAPYEVEKDVAIYTALADSEVPVPRLLAWTADPSIFVRPFSMTPFIAGESHDLSRVERWPVWQERREELGHEMIDVLAALHRFRWQETDIATVLGDRGGARERMAGILRRYLEPLHALARERGVGIPLWLEMGRWLMCNAPAEGEDELVVVHGDYRFGNLLWQDTRIAAVLDWERAMLGPRMQDLGFLCMPLSRRKDPTIMGKVLPFEALAKRYEASSGHSIDFAQIQYYAVLWQFLEGVNTTRSLLQEAASMISSGLLVQPNLVARQTLELMENFEAGREVL